MLIGILAAVYFVYSLLKKTADVTREASVARGAAVTRTTPKTAPKSKPILSERSLELIRKLDTSENVTITISIAEVCDFFNSLCRPILLFFSCMIGFFRRAQPCLA